MRWQNDLPRDTDRSVTVLQALSSACGGRQCQRPDLGIAAWSRLEDGYHGRSWTIIQTWIG